jgi:UDP-GlcNAc3NAcA epimerase
MSTLLFTPSITGLENLKNEGFKLHDGHKATANHPKVYHCGDVMFDNSMYFSNVSDENSTILDQIGVRKNQYILTTIHRDSNTDIAENMEQIFSALIEIQENSGLAIVLPIHPRTKSKMKEQLSSELYSKIESNNHFKIVPPAGFIDIISLEKNARLIITDSGGLQKEAFFFEKPCLILRPQTEWVEIVENGNAILVDASKKRILEGFENLIEKNDFSYPQIYGDGQAAKFICEKIIEDL